MKGTWKQTTDGSNGHHYCLGKIVVGHSFYDSTGPKGDLPRWACSCTLPGIKRVTERYRSEEEAQDRLVKQVDAWFQYSEERT